MATNVKFDAMLGQDFTDKTVDSIYTRACTIKINDRSFVDIVRNNVEPASGLSLAFNFG